MPLALSIWCPHRDPIKGSPQPSGCRPEELLDTPAWGAVVQDESAGDFKPVRQEAGNGLGTVTVHGQSGASLRAFGNEHSDDDL